MEARNEMTDRLTGKAAIVTGGASGFGAGIVECFLREGARVLIADIDEAAGKAAAEGHRAAGAAAEFRRVDVASGDEVGRAVAACEALFGAVDIMVANAGLGQRPCGLEETDEADFDRQFAVNVKGLFHCAKQVLPEPFQPAPSVLERSEVRPVG